MSTVRELNLIKAFEKYCNVQDEIEQLDATQEIDRTEIENRYYTLHAKIKDKIDELTSTHVNVSPQTRPPQTQVSTNQNVVNQVKLPNLSIPTFSGKYDDWLSFYDLFTALIKDNSQLNNVQKFVYLKSALKGEPLELISNLSLTNDNYEIAIETLKKRYDNKLSIINTHIKNMVDAQAMKRGTAQELRDFITKIKQNINSLETLKVPVKQWDLLLLHIFSEKLDFNTRKAYELEKCSNELPTMKEFIGFLESRANALENIPTLSETKRKISHLATTSNTNTKPMQNCLFCKTSNHTIYKCLKFKALPNPQKRQFVKDNKLCYNCLGTKHSVDQCSSRGCVVCNKSHHTLLHDTERAPPQFNDNSFKNNATGASHFSRKVQGSENSHSQTSNSSNKSGEQESIVCSALTAQPSQVLLTTASVVVVSSNGHKINCKALLDSGSQVSFITENLVNLLRYTPVRKNTHISGISGGKTSSNHMVDLNFFAHSDINCEHGFKVTCAILNKITCELPLYKINTENLHLPDNIVLADPLFHTPSRIDLLLGADIYYNLITNGIIKLGKDLPTLQNTYLGWMVSGPIKNNTESLSLPAISLFVNELSLDELLPKFWQIEELSSKRALSPEDKQCESNFTNSVKSLSNGRFEVNYPLRSSNVHKKLGDSYSLAVNRFLSLEKRLIKDKTLFSQYKEFIDEYVDLGHAEYVPMNLSNPEGDLKYFMPHHCVIRESSATTKIRVVFDASMKTSTGISLNDIMFKGFPVQPELFDILCMFRMFKFTVVADIQKMYRQISVNPSQRFLQNIIWRSDPN